MKSGTRPSFVFRSLWISFLDLVILIDFERGVMFFFFFFFFFFRGLLSKSNPCIDHHLPLLPTDDDPNLLGKTFQSGQNT